jgi:adenylate cyclase
MKQYKMEPLKERQLVAIMFTDIVGYSALMQQDEAKATKLRARHRAAFRALHALYGGEIIQYYGDGTLSVFKSAVNATLCAIEIQRRLQQGGGPVPLRIGLHMGDIVFDATEVYGDAVNVASRIESIATASSVLISAKLNDELKNHPSISTTSLGQCALKNIKDQVEVFAITNSGITVPESFQANAKEKAGKETIAVLPFVNMTEDATNEYFTDGITEEIISRLSKSERLRVKSRASSFLFKNTILPLNQIAHELNVSAILQGSVRRSDNTIRITAQLTRAEGDFLCWSESWNRKFEGELDIQEEISQRIAEKFETQASTQRRSVAKRYPSIVNLLLNHINRIAGLLSEYNQMHSWQRT